MAPYARWSATLQRESGLLGYLRSRCREPLKEKGVPMKKCGHTPAEGQLFAGQWAECLNPFCPAALLQGWASAHIPMTKFEANTQLVKRFECGARG
jgi:hypothetical protein